LVTPFLLPNIATESLAFLFNKRFLKNLVEIGIRLEQTQVGAYRMQKDHIAGLITYRSIMILMLLLKDICQAVYGLERMDGLRIGVIV
jgi:hypothetical protein